MCLRYEFTHSTHASTVAQKKNMEKGLLQIQICTKIVWMIDNGKVHKTSLYFFILRIIPIVTFLVIDITVVSFISFWN